jgi:hypothetical protein
MVGLIIRKRCEVHDAVRNSLHLLLSKTVAVYGFQIGCLSLRKNMNCKCMGILA